MKATTLLIRQHRKVKAAFKKLQAGKSDPKPLLEEISNDLAAHMAIEQEIFYPAIRQLDEDTVLEAYEEHSLAELALKRLRATDPESEAFRPRAVACWELLEHHIEEEEEELFPKVEQKLGEKVLNELGAAMSDRFDQVLEDGFEATVPGDMTRTSADEARSYLRGPEGELSEPTEPQHPMH
jgi:hemerythrin-like domain-containing protein